MQLRVRIIDKVRTFVNKIRHSTVLCDALRSYCKVIKKDYLKPDLDVATRWNSTFLMLEKFKRMREELDFLVCSNKHLETAYLNDDEWEQVRSMIVLLELMYKATKILSSSSYPTVSDIRLTFAGILRHIELYINDHSMEESMMADSIRKKLDDYWQILDTSTTISTILNPSSKLLTFSFGDQRDTAINQLRSKMVLYTPSQDLSNSNDIVSKDTSARSFFENLIMQQQNEI